MTAWWLPDDCLMTAWWLPDDCVMTAWWMNMTSHFYFEHTVFLTGFLSQYICIYIRTVSSYLLLYSGTFISFLVWSRNQVYTAIPYRASTGPEQGFPCVVNYHREKPVFIAGTLYSLQGIPCENYYTGKSL